MNPRKREARRPGGTIGRGRRPAVLAAVAGLIVLATGCAGQATGVAALSGEGTLAMSEGTHSGPAGNHEKATGARKAVGAAPQVEHAAAPPASSSVPGSQSSTKSGVTGGALFGGNGDLLPVVPRLGRHLAIVRTYYLWGQTFPRALDQHEMAQGSTLLVSLDTVRKPTYQAISSGTYDGYIKRFLESMERAAVQYKLNSIYFCFEHEPNVVAHHSGLGTPAEFRQAWDHIHAIAQSAHLNWNQGGRLHWVLILTHRAYIPMNQRPRWALRIGSVNDYYAGSSEVDAVGADGYDSPGCKPGTYTDGTNATPSSVFGPLVSWAHGHGNMAVFLSEWAGSATFPAKQAGFIRQMQPFIASHKQIVGALYWNSAGTYCSYRVNAHPASVAALAAMGHSGALQGHI